MKKKILIFILTYQSSYRLLNIMTKIKKLNLSKDSYKILISDDCSTDDTVKYIKKIKPSKNIKIIINKKNLHYGGNIKQCLNYAIKKKFDYAIMIHGDDQYDAKYIPIISKKLKQRGVDMVTGSRMLEKRNALRVDEFISYLLYEKNSYYISKNPIGFRGDFITSPEISQMFGEILGIYILN